MKFSEDFEKNIDVGDVCEETLSYFRKVHEFLRIVGTGVAKHGEIISEKIHEDADFSA